MWPSAEFNNNWVKIIIKRHIISTLSLLKSVLVFRGYPIVVANLEMCLVKLIFCNSIIKYALRLCSCFYRIFRKFFRNSAAIVSYFRFDGSQIPSQFETWLEVEVSPFMNFDFQEFCSFLEKTKAEKISSREHPGTP